MNVVTTGRKIEVSDALREYIEKKTVKLDKYFYSDATAKCAVSIERGRQIAEITVVHNGMVFRAQEASGDMYASVDKVVEALEKQIKKNKTKLEKRMREGAFDQQVGESFPEDDIEVLKVKHFALKPMSAEEAILQMNLVGHQFFLYQDVDENAACVVYKRSGGGYGLIIPEQ